MEIRHAERMASFKKLVHYTLEERKKTHVELGKLDRAQIISSMRCVAEELEPQVGAEIQGQTKISEKFNRAESKAQKLFKSLFMYPDSMIAIPTDLADSYSVMLKPAGERCLVVLRNNTVTLRSKNGLIIKQFVLDVFCLKRHDIAFALFDGVFDSGVESFTKPTIYIFDLLYWNKTEMIDSEYTCRIYFLHQNFPFDNTKQESPMIFGESSFSYLEPQQHLDNSLPNIMLVESVLASKSNMVSLYDRARQNAFSDSLVFYRNRGKYEAGLSQEAVYFRDNILSMYAVDTLNVDGFEGDESQWVVLKVHCLSSEGMQKAKMLQLRTWDNINMAEYVFEEVLLSCTPRVTEALNKAMATPKKFKLLIRAPLAQLDNSSLWTVSRKPFPFSFNRIVDQYRKRSTLNSEPNCEIIDSLCDKALTFEDILNAAS